MEIAVFCYESIVCPVQFVKQRLQPLIALVVGLIVKNSSKSAFYAVVVLKTFTAAVLVNLSVVECGNKLVIATAISC